MAFQVLFLTLKTLKESGHEHVYNAVEKPLLLAQSAAVLEASEKYCMRMPNKLNFSFDYYYAAIAILGFYVPGSPHLYSYMLSQRKRALSKSKKE
ncbi:hypothetical protein COLO4_27351 [Corchorus olitorius]|uniref:Very-long-chain (3R)-3-hydroxyacyl-CoA dehydratase n=1 Tax=Corchorus olitorius TaxID=93759 RepID=A0A1R3HRH0_9ROSI|nr:hypothetical protein COLO4_27351 [Corchorus olitorius]